MVNEHVWREVSLCLHDKGPDAKNDFLIEVAAFLLNDKTR